jgi:hypothetical protein
MTEGKVKDFAILEVDADFGFDWLRIPFHVGVIGNLVISAFLQQPIAVLAS